MPQDIGVETPQFELVESKPFLNVNLGRKIREDLTASLVRSSGENETEIKGKLQTSEQTLKDLLGVLAKDRREIFREKLPISTAPYAAFADKWPLTGEEEALALEYLVVKLLPKDQSARVYSVYTKNKERSFSKDENTIAMRGVFASLVGTNELRIGAIEDMIKGILDPTDTVVPAYIGRYLDDNPHLKQRIEEGIAPLRALVSKAVPQPSGRLN